MDLFDYRREQNMEKEARHPCQEVVGQQHIIGKDKLLSQAVTYVATAKSNAACNAVFEAMASVKRTKTSVPSHLQDAHFRNWATVLGMIIRIIM